MEKVLIPKWVSKEVEHKVVEAVVRQNNPTIVKDLKPQYFIAEVDGLLHVADRRTSPKDYLEAQYVLVGIAYEGQEKVFDIRMRKTRDGKWVRND